MRAACRAAFAPLVLTIAATLPAAQAGIGVEGPADLDQILQVTRVRESMSARLIFDYTYRQTMIEEDLDDDGRVKRKQVMTYQVVPTREGTERHLVSKDGEDPPASAVRKQEKRNAMMKRRLQNTREKAERAQPRPAATPKPAPVTTPPAPPASRPVAVTPPPPPPPRVMPAPAPPAAPIQPAAPAPPQLPECDFDDPLRAVRPPPEGSVTRSRAKAPLSPDEARRKRERASQYSLFELLNLTDYEYAGACSWNGRPMHVVTFAPPATFDPLNPVERVVTAMKGTFLIDVGDMEVARADGRTFAPITWGGGLVKLSSARVLLEYGRVHGEMWLPVREVFEFDSRVVMARERQRFTHLFDDFRKAQVEIESDFGTPVEEP